jgi:hypothetical protein
MHVEESCQLSIKADSTQYSHATFPIASQRISEMVGIQAAGENLTIRFIRPGKG